MKLGELNTVALSENSKDTTGVVQAKELLQQEALATVGPLYKIVQNTEDHTFGFEAYHTLENYSRALQHALVLNDQLEYKGWVWGKAIHGASLNPTWYKRKGKFKCFFTISILNKNGKPQVYVSCGEV